MELEGGEREWRGVEEGFALSEFATSSSGTEEWGEGDDRGPLPYL